MKGIWRHPADRMPALIVFSVLGVQLWAVFTVESVPALLAIALGLLLFSACPGSISHNHHHYNTFRPRWMNRIYEVILFLETGIPPFGWTIHHNLGHHKDYLDQTKDPSGWVNPDGSVMNRVKYDLYNAARVYPEIMRISRSRPRLRRSFLRWTAISLAVLGTLIWLQPVAALIIFVLPMPIMLVGLLDNTYQQHQDLDISSDYTASRNTTNRLYNLISWNLGYHTAHHLHPSTHWSELPRVHERIKERIPEHLIGDSVFLSECDQDNRGDRAAGDRLRGRVLAG
jgi:beta-carotene hydroxylase